jgi:RNA polymerase sigma factor (sigma-70 family)
MPPSRMTFIDQLVDFVRQGTLAGLVRRYHYACRHWAPWDDYCQAILLRALEHQGQFHGTSAAELAGWLQAIARQLMIDHLRRSRRDQFGPLPEQLPGREASPVDSVLTAEAQAERTRLLASILAQLDDGERELLVRHYWRREKLTDLAREWGVSPNTLTNRHLRLLRRLRALHEKND